MKYLTLFVFFISFNIRANQPIKIKIVSDDNYTPYSYAKKKQAKGIYYDILNIIIKKMHNYKVEIVPMPWKRSLNQVKEGDAFAIYPPYYYPNKRPYIKFFSLPILQEEVIVVCRPGVLSNKKNPKWPKDYYGLTIGNNAGFIVAGDDFYKAVKQRKIFMLEAKSTKLNIIKLHRKHIDCYINDKFAISYEIKKQKIKSNFITKGIVRKQSGYLGISGDKKFNHFRQDFISEFNKNLRYIQKSGKLDEILKKYGY